MTSLDNQLWELIYTHKMPEDATGTPFIDQLMTEHCISRDTARVAVHEYQKFMYLCATRVDRNVPSKAVDFVWHLHMQHSRDYWDVFCKKLGKPIHHTPGGEGSGHLADYKATVAAYKSLFGKPPKGIWRTHSKFGSLVLVLLLVVFMAFGAKAFVPENPELYHYWWMVIPLLMILAVLETMTAKGEFTLVFEHGDPFADDDAGDCGSGDGGGCGD